MHINKGRAHENTIRLKKQVTNSNFETFISYFSLIRFSGKTTTEALQTPFVKILDKNAAIVL